jgi:hypothetical protein
MVSNTSRQSSVMAPASSPSVTVAVGGIVGSIVGAAIATSVLALSGVQGGHERLPQVQAVGSLASDTFAACTTPMDNSAEGFFILDFQTGDLTGGVLNPQANAAKFTRVYASNVLKDLGFEAGKVKDPKFLLVAGGMNFVGPGSNTLAQSVLYVTDVSTGVTAAYGIPWVAQQARVPGKAEFVLLDIARPRGGGAAAP